MRKMAQVLVSILLLAMSSQAFAQSFVTKGASLRSDGLLCIVKVGTTRPGSVFYCSSDRITGRLDAIDALIQKHFEIYPAFLTDEYFFKGRPTDNVGQISFRVAEFLEFQGFLGNNGKCSEAALAYRAEEAALRNNMDITPRQLSEKYKKMKSDLIAACSK